MPCQIPFAQIIAFCNISYIFHKVKGFLSFICRIHGNNHSCAFIRTWFRVSFFIQITFRNLHSHGIYIRKNTAYLRNIMQLIGQFFLRCLNDRKELLEDFSIILHTSLPAVLTAQKGEL